MFVCWLFLFHCQYLLSDWLERLLWWHLNVVRRLPPQSPGGRECLYVFFLLFGLFMLHYVPLSRTQYIFHMPMAQYSLFVLKVPLNTNKTNEPNLSLQIMCNSSVVKIFLCREKCKISGTVISAFLSIPHKRHNKLPIWNKRCEQTINFPWHNIDRLCWKCHQTTINLWHSYRRNCGLEVLCVSSVLKEKPRNCFGKHRNTIGFASMYFPLFLCQDCAMVVLPSVWPHAGSGVVRMDPLRFLAGCRTRRLNQV